MNTCTMCEQEEWEETMYYSSPHFKGNEEKRAAWALLTVAEVASTHSFIDFGELYEKIKKYAHRNAKGSDGVYRWLQQLELDVRSGNCPVWIWGTEDTEPRALIQ